MRTQKVHGARVRLNAGKLHLFGLANKLVEILAHFRTLDEICEHLPSNSSKVFRLDGGKFFLTICMRFTGEPT